MTILLTKQLYFAFKGSSKSQQKICNSKPVYNFTYCIIEEIRSSFSEKTSIQYKQVTDPSCFTILDINKFKQVGSYKFILKSTYKVRKAILHTMIAVYWCTEILLSMNSQR